MPPLVALRYKESPYGGETPWEEAQPGGTTYVQTPQTTTNDPKQGQVKIGLKYPFLRGNSDIYQKWAFPTVLTHG